jgi:rhodanese-related sulfurtransferase
MKNRFLLLLLSVMFSFFFLTSCDNEDEATPINESETLATYLESTDCPLGKDYVNTDLPSIMTAEEVKTLNETGQVYIIDIRSKADYDSGHIKNANLVTFANILSHIKTVDMAKYTKVAVVCYTGQTAGYATSLLRFLGYSKVFTMKWGMSSWNSYFAGKWNAAVANGNAYASQFTATATEKGAKGNMPTLTTGKTTGQTILESRVDSLLAKGFGPASVSSATLFGSLTNYYIVNYWPADQYADPGHVPGAMQYTPKASMKLAADLKTLPTNKTIAVYCYTGHTSAFLVAYLRLLGYDAKSVLYGNNSMIFDKMVAYNTANPTKKMSVFGPSEIKEYAYEK